MRIWLLLLLSAVLTACATAPPLPPVSDPARAWAERQVRLDALADWYLEGRIGIRHADDAWQGGLTWKQQDGSYRLQVDGPFGQRQFSLAGGADGVELITSDDKRYRSSDAQSLLYAQTGVDMPVDALRYWVLGVPAPQGPPPSVRTLDDRGRLSRLVQAGWEVRFRAYTQVDGLELPEKLFVRHGEVELRLVVDRWRLLSGAGTPAVSGSIPGSAPATASAGGSA